MKESTLQAAHRALGESIVTSFCGELKIHPVEVFGSGRDRRVTRARMFIIRKLRDAGFKKSAIARLINCHGSTVEYWLCKDCRERRRASSREIHARNRKAAEVRA